MNSLTLPLLKRARGDVGIPGSKSLSNRILLLSALAEGTTTITNLLVSDDTRHMLDALRALGVDCRLSDEGTRCEVTGRGGPLARGQAVSLFLGNAGTVMRPLTAALCVGNGIFEMTGEPRMAERPIGDLIDALKLLGARVEYLDHEGFPPLRIQAGNLKGGTIGIEGGTSSQFLTALLMIAPLLNEDLSIEVRGELVSNPYVAITLAVMRRFGVEVSREHSRSFQIKGGLRYRSPGEIQVEGDASSASYFLAAGAIGGGPVRVHGTGTASVQGDARFAEVLEMMGAKVTWSRDWVEVSNQGALQAVDVDLNHIPDAAMTIATTALFAEGTTRIRNIYNWRVKETDRLGAMATELRKLGAEVDEGEDCITITPPAKLRPATIDTYNDHRMAMCFSLAAFGDAEITINDPDCTSKTFPDYFDRFASITG
ncbi:3-phosphoshikimate 1-carboxyvinyltransferase [Kineobactrum salinum]|uniref:3-phosphoshikimate 1-carboxyvinyltransferase n=1 Tax=Kineobactrum salinum TaxID=2708301 RepID=A0A6C0TYS6_9GAMM|nr:3-phosphoshikimate 1-carboxyvinyltransferase [Kineobactrum salinum]QIB64951.1 3-phosphoshikimate 1-carboxyvinyltransferase [Kineobactrum salinum]